MHNAQTQMLHARRKLEREKGIVIEEREQLAKDARLIFRGTVQELMGQGEEIEAQIERIKAEFQITRKVCCNYVAVARIVALWLTVSRILIH